MPHKSTALPHAECGVMRLMAPPRALADATLGEGHTLPTNIVDANLDGLVIGQRVWVVFHERA